MQLLIDQAFIKFFNYILFRILLSIFFYFIRRCRCLIFFIIVSRRRRLVTDMSSSARKKNDRFILRPGRPGRHFPVRLPIAKRRAYS